MVPAKNQYRWCVICNQKFALPNFTKQPSKRQTCSTECKGKLFTRNRRSWSEAEIAILKDKAETMPSKQLVRAFNNATVQLGNPKRTQKSISIKLFELGFSLQTKHQVYTTGAIARHLGLSSNTVRGWLRMGLESYKQTNNINSPFFITTRSLRRFARKKPHFFGGIPHIDLFLLLEDEQLVEHIVKTYPKRNSCITPPQPVRCIETGVIYNSYVEAAKAIYVSNYAIYQAIKFNRPVIGLHFERVSLPKR